MRVLGSLRSVPGGLWTRIGAGVREPVPAGPPQRFRRTAPPPPSLIRIPAIAYPDAVVFRIELGATDAIGDAVATPSAVAFDIELGIASAAGASVASPSVIDQRIEAGSASAVGSVVAKAARLRAQVVPILTVVYLNAPKRKDAVDRAWTDLQSQHEEDDLLELLGVFE